VVHACNLTYPGGGDGMFKVLDPISINELVILFYIYNPCYAKGTDRRIVV
jgi:hypothetical protein